MPLILILSFLIFFFIPLPASSAPQNIPQWAVLFYMTEPEGAISAYASKQANRLENIGSLKNASILLERFAAIKGEEEGLKTARRFYLKQDSNQSNFTSRPELELKALNRSDMKELSEFIRWAKLKYPAKHYMLFLRSRYYNAPLRCPGCYVRQDDINAKELALALAESGGVDVLAINSNGLQSADWLYELLGQVEYIVGAEHNMADNNYDYERFFSKLNQKKYKPKAASILLAESFVSELRRAPDISAYKDGYTQSVVRLSKLKALRQAAEDFANSLRTLAQRKQALFALSNTLCFIKDQSYDLKDFAGKITEAADNKIIKRNAAKLMRAIDRAVIIKLLKDRENTYWLGPMPFGRAGGLAIFLPAQPRSDYKERKWNTESEWEKFRLWLFSPHGAESAG